MRHRDKPWALIVVEQNQFPARRRAAALRLARVSAPVNAYTRSHACVRVRTGVVRRPMSCPAALLGLPVIMIMPARCARTHEKQKRERDASSPVFCTARRSPANFLLARDKNSLSIGNGGWWSHRYVSVEREEKKIVRLVRPRKTNRNKHERETIVIKSVSGKPYFSRIDK